MIQISGSKSALWWEQKIQNSGGKCDTFEGGKCNTFEGGKWFNDTQSFSIKASVSHLSSNCTRNQFERNMNFHIFKYFPHSEF